MTKPVDISKLQPELLSDLSWRLSPSRFATHLSRGKWTSQPHLELLSSWLVHAAARKRRRIIVEMPPRHGKALSCDTPILTERGWLPANAVLVGDRLVGCDGRWTRVLAVHPQGVVPLFRVGFSDGSGLVTCADHRWSVLSQDQRRLGGHQSKIKTTAELGADLTEDIQQRSKWRIPMVTALSGQDDALPLDPYLLGCWLGDGTSRRAEITSADPEIIESFRAAGFPTSYAYSRGKATTYGFLGLVRILREASLLRNKHIPGAYLSASIASRLALLQGLADTDGTVAKNGSQQSITLTSEVLVNGLKYLISSLGGTWTEYARPAAGKVAHTISFRLPRGMAGFRLHRKASRLAAWGARNKPRRLLRSIVPVPPGEAVCFTVEASDGLFCAGRELIVTHNSELSSVWFPSWYLDLFPDHRVMLASYEADFAESWGRRVRNVIQENDAVLNVHVASDSSSAARWDTTEGGGMMTAGVDGAFTGKGAHVLLIDDPIKNALKANSLGEREKIWDFYRSTAYTRLEPDGIIVLIMTRWNEDDLAGRLIDFDRQAELLDGDVEAERFDVLKLPAIATEIDALGRMPGDALWPGRFDLNRLLQIKHVQGTYFWSALYQQEPIPPEGGGLMFREEWFTFLDEEPEGFRWLRYWDRAATDPDPLKKNDPDWTIGLKLGIGPQRQLCVGDVVRLRGSPGAVKAKMLETAEADGHDVFVCGAQDPAAAGVSEVYNLKQMLKGFRCEFYPESGDKVVRAGPISAECEPKTGEKYGNVSVVRGDWNAPFFETLRVFPTKGKHDDDVDALSGGHSVILRKFPAPAYNRGASTVGVRGTHRA